MSKNEETKTMNKPEREQGKPTRPHKTQGQEENKRCEPFNFYNPALKRRDPPRSTHRPLGARLALSAGHMDTLGPILLLLQFLLPDHALHQ